MKLLITLTTLGLAVGACKDNKKEKTQADQPNAQETASATTPAETPAKTEAEAIKTMSVDELDKMLAAKSNCTPVDANGDMVRKEQGVIPGAVLISSSSKYDTSKLPSDKSSKLVFYCSNEMCGASKQAAKVAMNAGYQDVNVLPAGIMGWVKAGKEVSKPTAETATETTTETPAEETKSE